MKTDIRQIGIFGLSFSRGMDQTWFNLWHKEDGYSADIFQFVTGEGIDEPYIEAQTMVSVEQGENLLRLAFENGKIEDWKPTYGKDDEGVDSTLTWTIDVDDLEEQDMLFCSGNEKLPPMELMMGVIEAIRTCEPRFAQCFEEFR